MELKLICKGIKKITSQIKDKNGAIINSEGVIYSLKSINENTIKVQIKSSTKLQMNIGDSFLVKQNGKQQIIQEDKQ